MVYRRIKKTLVVAILILPVLMWFAGGIGMLMILCCDWFVLPVDTGINLSLQSIGYSAPEQLPEKLVEVRISSERSVKMIQGALGWKGCLVPPGIIRDGMTISGVWRECVAEDTFVSIPVYFIIDNREKRPVLKASLPVDGLNQLLHGTDILGKRVKRKKWALGHYELENKKTFDFMKFYSIPVEPGAVVYRREVVAEGAGQIRYTFDENLIGARTTARISKIVIKLSLDILYYQDGAGIDYNVRVTDMKGDFKNVAPALDRHLTEKFRESLESSLNRPKNHEKLSRKRIPDWVPIDSDFVIEFVD